MGVRVVFPDMGKDPSIQLIEKTITENGTYDAITDGANGYSKVNVNVEGGGGESDFSTANVTFINNNTTMPFVNCVCPNAIDGDGAAALVCRTHATDVPNTVKAVLYKGTLAIPEPTDDRNPLTVEVSGNASIEHMMIIITGDCTITIS